MLAIQRKAGRKISARKEVAEMDRLRRSYERKLESRLKRFFPRQFRQIANSYLETGTTPNLQNLDERIAPILSAHYREIMTVFGQRVLDKLEIKFDFDRLHRRYLFFQGGERIRGIDNWTLQRVQMVLRDASSEGLSNRETAKRIEMLGQDFSKRRSAVIARTETHTASSFAHHEMHKEFMGPKTRKQWVATGDARTRSGHAAMNGKEVGIEEDFPVPTNGVSVSMQYAGDPRGGAANVCNCRCTIIYVDESDELVDPVPSQPRYNEQPWLEAEGIKPTESLAELRGRDFRNEYRYQIAEAPDYILSKSLIRDNGVTVDEASAIYAYTDQHYRPINGYLRSWFMGSDTALPETLVRGTPITEKVKADLLLVNNLIKSGLKKMPKYQGEVTRGIDLPPDKIDDFIENMQVKKGATYRTEAIFSTGRGDFGWSGNVRFVIESKSGRYVDEISANDGEREVLFPAGHEFEIIDIEDNVSDYGRRSLLIRMRDLQDEIKQEPVEGRWPKGTSKVSKNFREKMQSQFGLASIDKRLIVLD